MSGYLLGSFLPAYFIAKIFKGNELRNYGTKNAGTINTYKVVGLFPALTTVLFDVGKGLLALYLGKLITDSSLGSLLAAGASVVGHAFPFYLKFRGGQAIATATGLMIYFLIKFYINDWLPWLSLFLLALLVIVFAWISRQGEFVGLFIQPSLFFLVLIFAPFSFEKFFLIIMIAYLLVINIINIWKFGLWKPSEFLQKGLISWRLYLRPLAFLLILFYFKFEKKFVLTFVGGLTLFFLIPDLLRLISSRINRFFFLEIKKIYKEKERSKFSSITLFLLSFFLTLLLFERDIAIIAVSFLVFGDFFSKIYGLRFGQRPFFEKTLEGSLAHLGACLMVGYLLHPFINFSLPVIFLGGFTATLIEALPLGLDDNLSVSLLSASIIYITLLF
ncbi:MAG: glycerol-3-phosphate acyltransferase [Candidatus Aminicenantes bacterium]|nr:glycerol-3-phosphate acyltransferase [Candidatus Aminicenantes bacterium]